MSTTLIAIGGVGFMFEVSHTLKHNLISPDVLSFFDGVQESASAQEDYAFPRSIPNTNLRYSIFQNVGEDWAVCSDGVLRKCTIVDCVIRQDDMAHFAKFHVDCSLKNTDIVGVISKRKEEYD